MVSHKEIFDWFKANSEVRIKGRFLPLTQIDLLLDYYSGFHDISEIGHSTLDRPIHLIKIGNGPKVIFGWSQMHGNETTTTKAIFDICAFFAKNDQFQDDISDFKENYSLYLIPVLNPDGAASYARENANGVDLNRDASLCTQVESRLLKEMFQKLSPHLCLNLHGQRSIYGLPSGNTSALSFLAPAIDQQGTINHIREIAMEAIVKINTVLQYYLPEKIGRYDDTFNADCVGDQFQMQGVPTVLFEAGHHKNDYEREETRAYMFMALLVAIGIVDSGSVADPVNAYLSIPQIEMNHRDVLIRNVRTKEGRAPESVALQFEEVLDGEAIRFEPIVDSVGDLNELYGHLEINGNGAVLLLNSHQKLKVGEKVTTITDKNDQSVEIFAMK